MSNSLLFEIGVSKTIKDLDKVKQQLEEFRASYSGSKAIKIKIEIDNLNTITEQLSRIGNTDKLQALRKEIEALNNEFMLLSKGAGGVGSINVRGMQQDIERMNQEIKSSINQITRLTVERQAAENKLKTLPKDSEAYARNLNAARESQKHIDMLNDRVAQLRNNIDTTKSILSQGASQSKTEVDAISNSVKALTEKVAKLASEIQKTNSTTVQKGGMKTEAQNAHSVIDALRQKNQVVEQGTKAAQQLATAESKSVQGNIFDPQKFVGLQEAIDKIISEINRLRTALESIGKIEGMDALRTSVNGLQVEVNTLVGSLSKISGALRIDKSAEEIAAYEKQIKTLKAQIDALQTSLKQAQDGMKMVASGKGSEATQNANLDTLRTQLEKVIAAYDKMRSEYERMEATGAQNNGLKERIELLRRYKEWIEQVAKMDLSKAGALKANEVKFNDQMLFGQMNRQMYSDKSVKDFSKLVDETIKAKAAADSLNDAFERMKQHVLGVGTAGSGGMRGVSSMMETINRTGERNIQTLIKEREHIDRLIAVAEKSIRFGEGHDVAGMQGLRSQQRENLEYLNNVKNAINHILENRNTPEWMRFLNTPGSLRVPLSGSGNDIALLGGHFDALKHSVTGTSAAMRQLQKDMRLDTDKSVRDKIKEQERAVKDAERENKVWANSMDFARTKANELTIELRRLEEAESKASKLGIDTTQLKSQIDILKQNLSSLYAMMGGSKIGGTSMDFVRSSAYKVPLETAKELRRILEDTTKTTSQKDEAVVKFFEKMGRSASNAGKAVSDLQKKFERFRNSKTFAKADALGIDTNAYSKALEALLRYKRILQYIRETGGVHDASRITGSAGYKEMLNNLEIQLRRLRLKVAETEKAKSANIQLSESERNLANAIAHSTGEMKNQSMILGDLKMMAYQYLSVWGAQSFLNNIIEIGGQLEKQRLSIAAILQDSAHGADLFDKIKRLAIQSPFGVIELDQFTKQLSAYGFKYNELYDMTKRLADISAGAGTEVSRLALALGHVRAESALSGYTLRQFAMNNIPMVSELAKKLSEVEGHLVTTADVRKRVSNKEISYQDVEDVIKKLTDEGGMFYQMQEVISESVQAKFKNLRDSFDIMYGDIAKSSIGDFLKDIASVLTKMSRNWQEFIPVLKAGGLAFLGYRGSLMAVNMAMGKNTAAVAKSILAYKARRASELEQISLSRNLTKQEKALILSKNELTASNIKAMMATKALNKDEVLRLVTLKKLSAEETNQLIKLKLFTQAEINAARAGSVLAARIKMIGTAMRTSIASFSAMIFNKWTALFAAIEVGMHLFQRQEQYEEDRKARMEDLWLRSREGQKNLGEMVSTYHIGLSAEVDEDGLTQAISDLKDKLKDYAPDVNSIFNEAFKVGIDAVGHGNKSYEHNVHTLAEQYEILAKALEDTEKAYKRLVDIRWLVDDALETTQDKFKLFGIWRMNSLFDDNIIGNIKNFAEASKDADAAMLSFQRDYHDAMNMALKAAGQVFNEDDIEGMEKAVRGLEKHSAEYIKFTRSLYAESDKSSRGTSFGAWSNFVEMYDEQKKQWGELEKDVTVMGERLFRNLTMKWGRDVEAWTTDQQMAVRMIFDDIIGKEMEAAGVSEEVQKKILALFMKPMGIKFQTETEAAYKEINELKSYLESITNKAWVVKLKVEGNDSVDIINEARKKRKEAKEGIDELEKDIKKKGLGSFIENVTKRGDTSMDMANTPAERRMLKDWLLKRKDKRMAEITLDEFGADYEEKKDKDKKGRGEDKEAKKLREIAKLYKDAYNWYKKYDEEVGEGSALEKVQMQFQPLFDQFNKEWGTKLNLDSIPEYRKNMEALLQKAQAFYEKPAHRNNYMVDAIKEFRDAISDVDYTEAKRKMDEFASKVQRDLDELTNAWETFNNVREATGNVELAVQISGADYANGKNHNLADAVREKIQKDFAASGVVPIAFNMHFDDDYIREQVERAFFSSQPTRNEGESDKSYAARLTKYQERIKGIIEEYKKWRDLQRDVLKKDIQSFSKIVGSAKDYDSQLRLINNELQMQKEANERLVKDGVISQEDANKANEIAIFEAREKAWKASIAYSQLFNNSLSMTRQQIEYGINNAMAMLNDKMLRGLITAQEYAEEMDKIRNIQTEWNKNTLFGMNNAFGAGIKGGSAGRANFYRNQVKEADKIIAAESRKARSGQRFDAVLLGNAYRKKNLNSEQLADWDKMENLMNSFDSLAKSLDPVIKLFDELGMKGVGGALQAGQSALSSAASTGLSSMLLFGQAAGPWGAAAGAALSLAGSAISAFGADYADYEKAKAEYEDLISIWDDLIDRKRTYLEESWGSEASNAGKEAIRLIQTEIDQTKELAKERLKAGKSIGSHSIGYRMWEGSYDYNGQNWRDVAGTISRQLKGVKFENMEDMLNMTSEQLIWIKENYSELWAHMDGEFKNHLDNIIKYGEDINDVLDDIAEKLHGLTFDELVNSYYDFVTAGEDANDVLAEDLETKLKEAIVKGMIENLYQDRINQLIKKANDMGQNSAYVDSNGNVKQHRYDSNGNLLDKDVASEFTKEEYELLKQMAESLGKEEKATYEMLKALYGWEDDNDSSNSSSSSIKNISESTADLLCSYVNGIRGHVALDNKMIAEYFPLYLKAITSSNDALRNIAEQAKATADNTEAIKRSNQSILDQIMSLRNKNWKVPVA